MEIGRLFLDEGSIDTRCRDESHKTALHHAAFNGHWQIVQLLIEYAQLSGSVPCTRNFSSRLDVTVNAEIVQRLLDHPDFQNVYLPGGWSPKRNLLHSVCGRGHCDAIRVLLAHEGIYVHLQASAGDTPLLLAVRHGHFEVVRLLLQHDGIDVNRKVYDNWTALDEAKRKQIQDMVDLLLSYGAIDDEASQPTTVGVSNNASSATMPNNVPDIWAKFPDMLEDLKKGRLEVDGRPFD
jgi:ankyrin repeat protein